MTILLFLAVLFVLILVHEWGHYITAKKTGMRVDEFGIGFPPRLFKYKVGETVYSFNLFPIGGFVRIYGENAEDIASGQTTEADASGSFMSKSKWAQALVLIAGVTMNVILAWFLFVAVFMIGVPTSVSEADATANSQLQIQAVLPESPAEEAGLPVGAVVTTITRGEERVKNPLPSQFQSLISNQATDDEVLIEYTLGNEPGSVTLMPVAGLLEESETEGIGVALALTEIEKANLFSAIIKASSLTVDSLVGITVGLGTLLAQSFSGTADFTNIAGPVGIVGLVGDAAQLGITSLLFFTAIISLNLAVINLLPFPALDGGRLVFVAIEAITRRPINPVWVMRLNAIGFFLLLLLMVAVTYSDVSKLL